MSRLPLRRFPRPAAAGRRALRGAAASGMMAVALAGAPATFWPGPSGSAPLPASAWAAAPASNGPGFRQIILPDLAVIEPAGLSATQVARLRKLAGIRRVLALDGAAISVRGHRVNVIGADLQQLRSWTPLATASDQRLWTALASGDFVSSGGTGRLLRLHRGTRYQLAGASRLTLVYGGGAQFGVAGVDLVVSSKASAALGLIHNVAALISAPGVAMAALKHEVRALLGRAKVVSLRQPRLPVDAAPTRGRPSTYLQLFRVSAARYCPGMSWTVLAAIGQIESGDGTNNGPSSAGAVGPMQFLPSTWQVWGMTAFGEPGPPNIMDPYDAVPSASRYLCAAGAGTPAGLPGAIFAYNHADWYVAEVLALARQYGQLYG
jgi:Transglycosylase SLT domain